MLKDISRILSPWSYFSMAITYLFILLFVIIIVFRQLYLMITKRKPKDKRPFSLIALMYPIIMTVILLFIFFINYRISPIDLELFKPWKITPDRSYLTIRYIKETKHFVGHFGGMGKPLDSYAFDPNNKIIGNAGSDGMIRFWSTENGKLLNTLDGAGYPGIVDISPDGKYFISKDQNNNITLWAISDYKLVKTIANPTQENIYTLRFSPDGKMIVSAYCDSQSNMNIKLLSTENWQQIASVKGHLVGLGENIDTFSPDSKMLTMNPSMDDPRICLWSIEENKVVKMIENGPQFMYCFCFSPDGSTIALSEEPIQKIELWSTATGALIKEIGIPNGGAQMCALRFLPDGKFIAWGHRSYWLEKSVDVINPVKIVSIETGEQIKVFGGKMEKVDYIDFTPDGKIIIAAGKNILKYDESDECLIKFWSVK